MSLVGRADHSSSRKNAANADSTLYLEQCRDDRDAAIAMSHDHLNYVFAGREFILDLHFRVRVAAPGLVCDTGSPAGTIGWMKRLTVAEDLDLGSSLSRSRTIQDMVPN
jgi:hypothetical protein